MWNSFKQRALVTLFKAQEELNELVAEKDLEIQKHKELGAGSLIIITIITIIIIIIILIITIIIITIIIITIITINIITHRGTITSTYYY